MIIFNKGIQKLPSLCPKRTIRFLSIGIQQEHKNLT